MRGRLIVSIFRYPRFILPQVIGASWFLLCDCGCGYPSPWGRESVLAIPRSDSEVLHVTPG